MLAAASFRFNKAVAAKKSLSSGLKARKYSVAAPKPATYSPKETASIQSWLDKVNADPVKQNALNAIVEGAKRKSEAAKKFWSVFGAVKGVKVPGPGLQREVLAGVVLATSQSWSEYLYALRTYQSKLQQDETFYNLHAALRSKDKAEAKKAEEAITKFIGSIQTKANTAKMGVLRLVRAGKWDGIRNGDATNFAVEYINRFKREVKVEITTAQKLSAQDLEHYESRFRQIAGDERTKIFITTKEDPSILGGEILNINGAVYDKSWKREQEEAINVLAQFNNNL